MGACRTAEGDTPVTEAKLAAVLWLAKNKPFNWFERIDEVFECRGWEIYHWARKWNIPLQ